MQMNCLGNSSIRNDFRKFIDGRNHQEIRGAEPPGFAGGSGGAAPWFAGCPGGAASRFRRGSGGAVVRFAEGPGGAAPWYCRESGGRIRPVLQGAERRSPPAKQGGLGSRRPPNCTRHWTILLLIIPVIDELPRPGNSKMCINVHALQSLVPSQPQKWFSYPVQTLQSVPPNPHSSSVPNPAVVRYWRGRRHRR